nr:hypothetical protein [uncultured Selenomonas sp.]
MPFTALATLSEFASLLDALAHRAHRVIPRDDCHDAVVVVDVERAFLVAREAEVEHLVRLGLERLPMAGDLFLLFRMHAERLVLLPVLFIDVHVVMDVLLVFLNLRTVFDARRLEDARLHRAHRDRAVAEELHGLHVTVRHIIHRCLHAVQIRHACPPDKTERQDGNDDQTDHLVRHAEILQPTHSLLRLLKIFPIILHYFPL